MSKPTVVLHDTRDDRREVLIMLDHFTPAGVVKFLSWACEVAWGASPTMRRTSSSVQPSESYRLLVAEAAKGCMEARKRLYNEVLLDLAAISHNYGVDFSVFLVELQNRAKGREPTPVPVAVQAIKMKAAHDLAVLQNVG